MFKARQVPKSLYERPSKKKQAANLKSASRSISSETVEHHSSVNGWAQKSPGSDGSFGILQFSNNKENFSVNPQASQTTQMLKFNFIGTQQEHKLPMQMAQDQKVYEKSPWINDSASTVKFDFRNTQRNIFGSATSQQTQKANSPLKVPDFLSHWENKKKSDQFRRRD